jgi:hypothetical protein
MNISRALNDLGELAVAGGGSGPGAPVALGSAGDT